jgi:uncharacterized paraquat-inducible protein A
MVGGVNRLLLYTQVHRRVSMVLSVHLNCRVVTAIVLYFPANNFAILTSRINSARYPSVSLPTDL